MMILPDCINCEYGCNSQIHHDSINSYYGNIVVAFQETSYSFVHRVAFNSLKPFWNDVLDKLKMEYFSYFGVTYGLSK